MIQDIYPHVLRNEYRNDIKCSDSDQVIVFHDGRIMMIAGEDSITFPLKKQLNIRDDLIYLFALDDHSYFLYMGLTECPPGFEYEDVRQVRRRTMAESWQMLVLFTAWHLAVWYRDNRCCGRCGHETVHDDRERAMLCPQCGKKEYPRINPAVIVGVTNGNKLLLTRYRTGYGSNALVAGFTEIGETLEQTVRREVREETGLEVKNIRYYKSQPWGIAADILAGFYCDVDGDDTITMDENELKQACWTEREDIVLQETEYSLTNEMMKMFREGKI